MPGRSGNRRRAGRGGRGNNSKESEDCYFHVGSPKQYKITFDFVIYHIMETFDSGYDIFQALRTLKEPDTILWKPTLSISTSTDAETKAKEDDENKIEYKADLELYDERIVAYRKNRLEAYELLWERSSNNMRKKVMALSDYESSVRNNPIELAKAVKDISFNPLQTSYKPELIFDSFQRLLNCKQRVNESLHVYTRRFELAREVMEYHMGGSILLGKSVEKMPDYDESDKDKVAECQKRAAEAFMAYMYMENSDVRKYGSILQYFHSQFSLGNDLYPKTIGDAYAVMKNHRFDYKK